MPHFIYGGFKTVGDHFISILQRQNTQQELYKIVHSQPSLLLFRIKVHRYIENLLSFWDIIKAKKLWNSFRYLDDLLSLNDKGLFDNFSNLIYPSDRRGHGVISWQFFEKILFLARVILVTIHHDSAAVTRRQLEISVIISKPSFLDLQKLII